MSLRYADTSALVRAYFADEPDHAPLRASLLEADDPVVTSEVTRVEIASAVRGAAATGRLPHWRGLLDRIDADCAEDGPIALLALRPRVVLPTAHRLVLDHRLRTLDAIHLAVAVEECPALADGEDIVFVTRDRNQGAVAAALGLSVE
ncbi:MAG TPA: type II toxin-antitoxin system VapC family toxin [Actinomycetes bacterium]|nr:type II toxin-antitoxin system VapC family toxin [Actinomycetes bacterium]